MDAALETIKDIFELNNDLNDEQRAICDAVRKFVDREVVPQMTENQERGIFPKDLLKGVAELGILELIVAGDLDPMTYGLVMSELERGGSTIRSLISVQGALVIFPFKEFGSEEQKKTWLEPLGKLDAIGCFGLTAGFR